MKKLLLLTLPLCLQFSSSALQAEDILSGLGGFEQPLVNERTPKAKGGDPTFSGEHGLFWSFNHKLGDKGGSLTSGLTNETAHSGKQCLYIEADKFSAQYEGAGIQSNPIPILPGHSYKLSIWGKMDSKKPFVIKNRPIYLKLQADFLSADKVTQVGDTVYLVQPIPGTKNRDPFFDDKKWTEFGTEFSTPSDAAYAVVTWRWEAGSETGETSGLIYFDDFSIVGAMPPHPIIEVVEKESVASPEEGNTSESGEQEKAQKSETK